ncbi:MAG TPA: VOC family protein [Acidimicrobiales bacterium]
MSKRIVHFEIVGPDDEPLRRFYRQVLEWDAQPMGPGYSLITTPDGSPDGAITEGESAELTIGVEVPDLAGALASAVEHGGQVVMPAADNGWVVKAKVADPAGNIVTLIAANEAGQHP